jgi:hypothetical protein
MLLDCERLKNESWLDAITPYAPLPGMDLLDLIVHFVKQTRRKKRVSAWNSPHSPRGNTGYLFATEYEFLKNALPQATFFNAVQAVDLACYIKEPGEIKLLPRPPPSRISGITCVRDALDIGMMETQIAGIGEMELRRTAANTTGPSPIDGSGLRLPGDLRP